jgi:tRNA (guanosine-2'-O-)-methyltransferase
MVEKTSHLPFKTQIINSDELEFGGKKFSLAAIVEILQPFLTAPRVVRIEEVIAGRTYNIATVAEHLYDIGNISAVMRSAESFGFLPFHIVERPESKYKMSDRISRGTEKWLDIHKHKSPESYISELNAGGYEIFATDLNATCSIEDIDFTKKIALVFGNEKEGISESTKALATGRFKIPMYGFAQSFNISVAASLCFYHVHASRRKKLGGVSGDLSPEERLRLRAHYYLRTLDSAEQILIKS